MKRKIYPILFILFVFPVFVFAQNYDAKINEIDAYAQRVQADWKIPGLAIAIVKDDKVIFQKGYGVRDINKTDRVDENTLFAIASNSKAFTTASLAILIDEKKIGGWDVKVSKYLPEFQMYDPYVTNELTIRDLVSHRSGLDTFSGDLLWYDTTYGTDEILRRVRFLKPVRGFRAGYGYQNLMFVAAGRIVEKVSGKKWGEFIEERILKPLGMSRTTTTVRDLKRNYALPHNESYGGKLRALPLGNIDAGIGLAGLNSSVADVAKWLRLQLGRGKFEGKQIYTEQRANEMWQQNVFIPVNSFPAANAPTQMFNGYGLGWFINDYRGKKLVSHTGGLDGMITQTAMIPSESLGLVVLTNSETGAIGIMRNKILDVFLNAPQPQRDWNAEALERDKQNKMREAEEDKKKNDSRVANTRPSLSTKDYAGTYSSEMYGDVSVTEENGKLVMRLNPAPNFVADLEHWHYDTFQIKWRSTVNYNFPRGWVTFTLDGQGKTEMLKIDQPNNDFWFYELELRKSK
jgi:CubicO group peptidase (beta-lactamase class C family)